MKSSCKNFDVFDFKPEDEDSEFSSVKFARKFKNPNDIDKYKFLENYAVENDHNYDSTLSYIPLGTEEEESEDPATKSSCGLDAVLLFNSMSDEQHPHFIPDKIKPGCVSAQLESRASSPGAQLESRASSPEAASPCNNQLNCAPQESLSSDESGDMITGAYESMSESSPSTSSYIPGDDGSLDGHGPLSDLCFGNWEMGDRNVAVVFPDYIVYRGRYFTSHLLIFSSNCIEMKDSTVHGNHGTISFEWGIDDIVGIESQWLHRRRIATVKLCLISKDDVQAEDKQGPSGIEELVFTVVNSNWYEKQKEIISLNVRYNSLWNVVFNTDVGGDGEALSGQNDICISKERYCPVFDDPFEEVVYPKGDSDAVSISKRDVDLLQPDTFVNDTIIDFYIKYLKTEMTPEKSLRFHFFNSFFFRKLIDLDKDPPSSFEGRAAFQRVRKWTRKVNLFEKDYVLIPVNFNYHWSLIVICHPGEVAEFQDEEVEKPLKVPCILHMDSIKGTHGGLKDFVQSYLWEEWKEKKKEASEDISSKFFSLRFVPLELPQQQNSFDCGLFLLHYVERFLQEAPLNFSPFQITKLSNFLNVDWFPADEPFLKRASIQKLICKILERENSPAACSGKLCASDYPTSSNKIETGVEFTSERCSPLKSCNGKVSTSPADQKIEITLLPTSSECAGDSGLVLREFFEAGTTSESFLDGPYQTLDRAASFNEFKGAISLMEEDVEVGGQFVHSSSGRTGFQQLTGIAPRGCGFPYLSSDFCAGTSWIPGNHHGGHEDIGASPEMSICASDDSSEVEVKESNLVGEDLGIEERIDPRISLSTGDKEGLTESLASAPSEIVDTPDSQSPAHVLEDKEGLKESLASSPSEIPDVADSGSPSHVPECKGNEDPLNSCPNNLLHLLHQHSDVQENGDVAGADLGLIGDTMCETDGKQVLERSGDDSVTESDEQQAVKRLADDSFPESDELQPAKRLRLAEDLQL